jgi:hypothetical protein
MKRFIATSGLKDMSPLILLRSNFHHYGIPPSGNSPLLMCHGAIGPLLAGKLAATLPSQAG